jgi:hypothetical protein
MTCPPTSKETVQRSPTACRMRLPPQRYKPLNPFLLHTLRGAARAQKPLKLPDEFDGRAVRSVLFTKRSEPDRRTTLLTFPVVTVNFPTQSVCPLRHNSR